MRSKEINDAMINLRAPATLVATLEALAREKRRNFSDYVRFVLHSHTVKHKPKEKEVRP